MPELHFQPNLGCGICYEAVEHASTARPMTCCHSTHILHHHCATLWFLKQRQQNIPPSCPFCRTVILSLEDFDRIYTFKDVSSPRFEPIYADADAPLPYLPNFHIVHLTYASYLFMIVNVFFIIVIFLRLGM
tara:strand:- start:326 stop:721 length:396 start_codon:yes stop_codon:yes gene_type:complete